MPTQRRGRGDLRRVVRPKVKAKAKTVKPKARAIPKARPKTTSVRPPKRTVVSEHASEHYRRPRPKPQRKAKPPRSVMLAKPKRKKVYDPNKAYHSMRTRMERTRKAQRGAAKVAKRLPGKQPTERAADINKRRNLRIAKNRLEREYGTIQLTHAGRTMLKRELRQMKNPTYKKMKAAIERHKYKAPKAAGISFDVGRAVSEMPGMGKRWLKGGERTAVGFIPGVVESVRHPIRAAEATAAQVKHDFAPLVKGDFKKFGRQVVEDPFGYTLYAPVGYAAGKTVKRRVTGQPKRRHRWMSYETGNMNPEHVAKRRADIEFAQARVKHAKKTLAEARKGGLGDRKAAGRLKRAQQDLAAARRKPVAAKVPGPLPASKTRGAAAAAASRLGHVEQMIQRTERRLFTESHKKKGSPGQKRRLENRLDRLKSERDRLKPKAVAYREYRGQSKARNRAELTALERRQGARSAKAQELVEKRRRVRRAEELAEGRKRQTRSEKAQALRARRSDVKRAEAELDEAVGKSFYVAPEIKEAQFHRSPSEFGADIQDFVDYLSGTRLLRNQPVVGRKDRVNRQAARLEREDKAREAIFGELLAEGGGIGNPIPGLDTALDVTRAAYVYSNPAYIPRNIAGGAAMLGMGRPLTGMQRLGAVKRGLDDTERKLLGQGVGEGPVRSLYTHEAKNKIQRGIRGLAEFQSRWGDKPLRERAFLAEAWAMGYRNAEQVGELLRSNRRDIVADRRQIEMESRRMMVDFNKLQPWEKTYASRIIFLYPWMRRASAYGLSLPIHKPGVALGAGLVGEMGAEANKEFWGSIPPWMRGTIPLGGVKTLHGKQAQWIFNPFAADPLSTAVQAGGDVMRAGEQAFAKWNDPQQAWKLGSYLQPPVRMPAERMHGKSFFTGRSLRGENLGEYLTEQLEMLPVPRLGRELREEPGTVHGSYMVPGPLGKLGRVALGSLSPGLRLRGELKGQRRGEEIRRANLKEPTEREKIKSDDIEKQWKAAFKKYNRQMPERLRRAFVVRREQNQQRAGLEGGKGYIAYPDQVIADLRTLAKFRAGPFAKSSSTKRQMMLSGYERRLRKATTVQIRAFKKAAIEADWWDLFFNVEDEIGEWQDAFTDRQVDVPFPGLTRGVKN